MEKRYFVSKREAIEFNKIEAESRGCDMLYTTMWWEMGEDENGWYLVMTVDERDVLSNGVYVRSTGEMDVNGNVILEQQVNPVLSDGTVLNALNKDIYDGAEGWHWYEGEIGITESPSTWETIKNWFKF